MSYRQEIVEDTFIGAPCIITSYHWSANDLCCSANSQNWQIVQECHCIWPVRLIIHKEYELHVIIL